MTFVIIENYLDLNEYALDPNMFELIAKVNSKILLFTNLQKEDFILEELHAVYGSQASIGFLTDILGFSQPQEALIIKGDSFFINMLSSQ